VNESNHQKRGEIEDFDRNVHGVLAPGGILYTSATRYEKRSESLLKTFKLLSQYRTIDHLDALLDKLAWEALRSFGTEPDFRLTSMLKCLLADPRTDCHEASNRQNVGGRRGEVRT
jgi:hypothetical protein